jgi:hypothetical protein
MRYFLISVFLGKDRFGQVCVSTDGEHPSMRDIMEECEDYNVIVLNIHEFKNEEDFNDFKEGITIN